MIVRPFIEVRTTTTLTIMNEMFHKVSKMKFEIEGQINNLYNSNFQTNTDKTHIQEDKAISSDEEVEKLKKISQDISQKIANLKENIASMSNIIETTENNDNVNTNLWKWKLTNIKTSPFELISYLDKTYKYRLEKIKYEKEKENLFRNANKSKRHIENEDVKILVEDQESLKRSQSKASEIINQGYDIIHSLNRQHDILKKIQKRAYTILNDMGISNSFAKLIERRGRNDFYIMVCLFTLLIIIVFILYYYIRPMVRS